MRVTDAGMPVHHFLVESSRGLGEEGQLCADCAMLLETMRRGVAAQR